MTFEELVKIDNEVERIKAIYEIFNEDTRLNRSKAARVEFLTTVTYIEKHLRTGSKILDIGAGAGEYSLYFAEKGYEVSAVELVEKNFEAFKKKIKPNMSIDARQGNACDLSGFEDDAYDIVLLFGPLYHLSNKEDREKCINEAKRVCKKDGTLFFSFISNDMVIATEFYYRPDFFKEDSYDHETFKLVDFPFVFFTVDQARKMLEYSHIKIVSAIASDGISELLEEKINKMDDESYEQWLRYHFYCCEKPEMLGCSNHLLYIGHK